MRLKLDAPVDSVGKIKTSNLAKRRLLNPWNWIISTFAHSFRWDAKEFPTKMHLKTSRDFISSYRWCFLRKRKMVRRILKPKLRMISSSIYSCHLRSMSKAPQVWIHSGETRRCWPTRARKTSESSGLLSQQSQVHHKNFTDTHRRAQQRHSQHRRRTHEASRRWS